MTTTRTTPEGTTHMPAARTNTPAVIDTVSTEIVHAGPSTVAAALTATTALDAFDDLDLSPEESTVPLLPINRKVGQDESGILINGAHVLEVDFVWAARSTSRAHFPERFDVNPNSRPDCFSVDGTTPAPQATNPKHTTCAGCPFSFEATGGKDTPDGSPGCSKNLEALVYLDDGDGVRVARLRFGGIAYKAARDYWESFKFSRPRLRSVQFMTHMALESVKTDNGNFLSPVFTRAAQLDDTEALAVAGDARDMLGSFRALVAEDVIDGAARDVDTEPGPFDDPAPAPRPDVDPATGEIRSPREAAATVQAAFAGTYENEPVF